MQYFVITAIRQMMMQEEIELVVDEPIVGHFYWTIVSHGQAGERPHAVDYARGPLPTRSTAMRIGASALRLRQEHDAEACARTSQMLSAMRAEWNVETMPAGLS